jgi:hypothetical protein
MRELVARLARAFQAPRHDTARLRTHGYTTATGGRAPIPIVVPVPAVRPVYRRHYRDEARYFHGN